MICDNTLTELMILAMSNLTGIAACIENACQAAAVEAPKSAKDGKGSMSVSKPVATSQSKAAGKKSNVHAAPEVLPLVTQV